MYELVELELLILVPTGQLLTVLCIAQWRTHADAGRAAATPACLKTSKWNAHHVVAMAMHHLRRHCVAVVSWARDVLYSFFSRSGNLHGFGLLQRAVPPAHTLLVHINFACSGSLAMLLR